MLKQIVLSTLFTVSAATAQINLDLNLTLTNQDIQNNIPGSISIDEEVIVPVEFNGLNGLVVGLLAKKGDDNIIFNAQFFQKSENDELVAVTQVFETEAALNETATIIVNDPENENTSLTLTITPTNVE
jgi:Na+-transporting NADH:ubiquinone oxidoreductase subunit NqrC